MSSLHTFRKQKVKKTKGKDKKKQKTLFVFSSPFSRKRAFLKTQSVFMQRAVLVGKKNKIFFIFIETIKIAMHRDDAATNRNELRSVKT